MSRIDKVPDILRDKANKLSSITGIPRTKSYRIFSQTIPHIESTQILQNPRSSKKRIIVRWVQEYDL